MPPSGTRPVIAIAAGAQGFVVLTLIQLGTLSPSIREDLGIGEGTIGACIAVIFAVGALASISGGRTAQRAGPSRGMRRALAVSAVAQLGIAVATRSVAALAICAALIGISLALVQPATDLWITRRLPVNKQGFAMGTKQAMGGPGIGLLAGLLVPLAAVIGWRWMFAAGGVGAACLAIGIRGPAESSGPEHPGRPAGDINLLPLVVLAIAGGLGSLAQTGFTSFAVSSIVDAGRSETFAGLIFAMGTCIAVTARIAMGALSDRRAGGLLVTMTVLMLLATVGFGLMATESIVLIAIAIPVLCVTCWGWQGVFFLAVVRSNPGAPATASGIAGGGLLAGGVLGPLVIGVLAEADYTLAWIAAGVLTAAGAAATVAARSLAVRATARMTVAGTTG